MLPLRGTAPRPRRRGRARRNLEQATSDSGDVKPAAKRTCLAQELSFMIDDSQEMFRSKARELFATSPPNHIFRGPTLGGKKYALVRSPQNQHNPMIWLDAAKLHHCEWLC